MIWNDKAELKPGDESGNEKIEVCSEKLVDLFLPLLSADAEAHEEGYFHERMDESPKIVDGASNLAANSLFPSSWTSSFVVRMTTENRFPRGFARCSLAMRLADGRLPRLPRQILMNSLRELRRRRPG